MPPETPEPMVQDFVTKAEHDLLAATILAREPRLADAVCFHCQQAVEKMLKAALRVGENVNRREFVAREASREGTLPRLPQDEREARRQEIHRDDGSPRAGQGGRRAPPGLLGASPGNMPANIIL